MIRKYNDFSDSLVDRCVKSLRDDLDAYESFMGAIEWVKGFKDDKEATPKTFGVRDLDEWVESMADIADEIQSRYETRLEFASEVLGISRVELEYAVRP